MSKVPVDRRTFLTHTAAGVAGLAAGVHAASAADAAPAVRPAYTGPNVILIRFGGGVRRLETILQPEKTYCPFVYHELFQKRGILFKGVEIESGPGIETSHGQGTLHVITGQYKAYINLNKTIGDRFEPTVPTVFEYFRKQYNVPEYQTLIINGEDRIDEEFYTFSNHHQYGVEYRSTVLSLFRFKTYLLREDLKRPDLPEHERAEKQKKLNQMENLDARRQQLKDDLTISSPQLDRFWENWRAYYGRSGLVNPRGDRVLTELALRALRELRPKLMMINYQDPDYVHWGNPNFYTRSISIIDDGIRQIHDAVQADEQYRDNTAFIVVPDCGRDNARGASVPFQHHFGSRSSHEIFVIAAGPGIARSPTPVDTVRQQTSVAATIGQLMKFPTEHVDAGAGSLEEMLA
jgi:hypothetical protein